MMESPANVARKANPVCDANIKIGEPRFEFDAIKLLGAVAVCATVTPILRFEVLSGTSFD